MTDNALKKPEPIAKGPRKLLERDMYTAETARPFYRIIISDTNTTFEDVKRPEFWANVAYKFNKDKWRFAIVELIWADGSKYMKGMIMDCGPVHAIMAELDSKDFSKDKDLVTEIGPVTQDGYTSEYTVVYKGTVKRWCVIRTSDGEIISHSHELKEMANKYLEDYLKALKI